MRLSMTVVAMAFALLVGCAARQNTTVNPPTTTETPEKTAETPEKAPEFPAPAPPLTRDP
jgi:uncharacterized lipoprotein YajG